MTPSNPRSVAQQFVRSNLAFLAQKWRTLTEQERDSWGAQVQNYTRTDIFGDIKVPTGYNLFMRINTALRDASTELFFNVPAPAVDVAGLSIVGLNASASPQLMNIIVESEEEANGYLLIDASPMLSAGINSAGTRYKRIKNLEVLDFSDLNSIDILSDYQEVFGELVSGQKVFVRVTVMMSNGQRGVPTASGTIVASDS